MFRCAVMLLLVSQVIFGNDFLKQLTPKEFKSGSPENKLKREIRRFVSEDVFHCAIPLKEIRAGNSNRFDPMAIPNVQGDVTGTKLKVDEGIKYVAMPVCTSR